MHALLTALVAAAGAGLAGWGLLRAVRHRARGQGGSPRARRTGLWAYAAGGLLLLLPDVLAGLVVAPGAPSSEATALLGTLAGFVWRSGVVLGIGLGAVVLALTGRRVTTTVATLVHRVPRRADLRYARLRHTRAAEFPREWDALIEHDRALARRLLEQGNSLQERAALDALRDFEDPVTREAMEALVECDRVRTPAPPPGTRDVLGTRYGQAVLAFEDAVAAAEANARERARGSV